MHKTKCKCGQEIHFIKIKKTGRSIPCNVGLIILVEPKEKMALVTSGGEVLVTNEPDVVGYEPHWVTCPFASEFRNKLKKEKNNGN